MQYLLLLYLDETVWPKMSKAEQDERMQDYVAYHEALTSAGVLVGSNRLRPTTTAKTVRITNDKPQIMDGPFAESKEHLGGYILIDVADLETALSWAARCPTASHGVVETRAVWPSA